MQLQVEAWILGLESPEALCEPLRGETRYAPDAEPMGVVLSQQFGGGTGDFAQSGRDPRVKAQPYIGQYRATLVPGEQADSGPFLE